jgi:branched-chain amino acid transport system permease protein
MSLASAVSLLRRRRGFAVTPALAAWVGGPVAAILLVFIAPSVLSEYWLFVATSAVIFALAVFSGGIVIGLAGMMTLCQLSFAAIGAWTFADLNTHGTLPFILQVLVSGLVAVPFGLVIGLPALRLRGINLAVVTLAFAIAIDAYLTNHVFPGSAGTTSVLVPAAFSSASSYFDFSWVTVVILFVAVCGLRRSRIGSAWLAVRQSERATAAVGGSVPYTKLTAFAVSAFIAGIAGALTAGQLGILAESNFDVTGSITLFAVAVMVGAQNPEGAVLGGVLYAFLPVVLPMIGIADDWGNLLFAFGAIQALMKGGGGASSDLRRVFRSLIEKRLKSGVRELRLGDAEATPRVGGAARAAPVRAAPVRLAAATPAFEIRNLTVRYGQVTAVSDVSLTVAPGEVAGLIGPNGAGKSTLVDAASGFIRTYQGSVLLDGTAVDRLAPHRRARAGLRRTFQQDRTIHDLSVGAYLDLAAGRRVGRARRRELLEFFVCPPPEMRVGGVDLMSRRLVEIAGAVAASPKVLLLDEPAAGLSPQESVALGERLVEIPERFGSAVLLIEHDIELVQAACRWITVLDFGSVIASAEPAEALRDQAVAAAYLGQVASTA